MGQQGGEFAPFFSANLPISVWTTDNHQSFSIESRRISFSPFPTFDGLIVGAKWLIRSYSTRNAAWFCFHTGMMYGVRIIHVQLLLSVFQTLSSKLLRAFSVLVRLSTMKAIKGSFDEVERYVKPALEAEWAAVSHGGEEPAWMWFDLRKGTVKDAEPSSLRGLLHRVFGYVSSQAIRRCL